MNIERLHFLYTLNWFLVIPFGIMILKMILQITLRNIHSYYETVYQRMKSDFFNKYGWKMSIKEFAEKSESECVHNDYAIFAKVERRYNVLEHNRFYKYLKNTLDFTENGLYFGYCLIAWMCLIFSICNVGFAKSDFKSQLKIYNTYTKYCNYTEHPLWNIDAKRVILSAEAFNEEYFQENGTLKGDKVTFLLKDDNDKYIVFEGKDFVPLNTNKMWLDAGFRKDGEGAR